MASERISVGTAIGREIAGGIKEALAPLKKKAAEELAEDEDRLDTDLEYLRLQEWSGSDADFWVFTDFHAAIRRALKAAESRAKGEEHLNKYLEWRAGVVKSLKDMLEHQYPGRWDLQDVGTEGFDDSSHTMDRFAAVGFDFTQLQLDSSLYVLYIHFPEIVITNSVGNVWTIKDMYIKVGFDYKMSMSRMEGYRATKTPREYQSNYSHSHMHPTNGWSTFCLGSTPLDTLVGELVAYPFNEMKWELYFQTLPDYLSWESLEGGPYITMQQGVLGTTSNSVRPELTDSTVRGIVNAFIRKKPRIKYNVSIAASGAVNIIITPTLELIKQLTEVVPEELKFPLTQTTLQSIYPVVEAGMDEARINAVNKSSSAALTFKGKHIRLRVEKPEKTKEEETKVERFADSRLVSHVVTALSEALRTHIYNSFWYGTSKKG